VREFGVRVAPGISRACCIASARCESIGFFFPALVSLCFFRALQGGALQVYASGFLAYNASLGFVSVPGNTSGSFSVF